MELTIEQALQKGVQHIKSESFKNLRSVFIKLYYGANLNTFYFSNSIPNSLFHTRDLREF